MGIAIRADSQAERPRVRVAGTVQVIRHDRIGGMRAMEAELQQGPGQFDHGRVELIWLGRASITGIKPGIAVVAERPAEAFAAAARPCSTRATG